MPIYGYQCTQCGHTLEVLQSMSEPPLRECPVCMGPLQKIFYPVGVIYKGSGFYSTDYKSGGKANSGSAAKASETADGKASGGDAKPTSSGEIAGEKTGS